MTEPMAALFVSTDGELRCFPEVEEQAFVDDQCTPWELVTVPESVVVGILRLMRERDEARRLVELHASMDVFVSLPWRNNG